MDKMNIWLPRTSLGLRLASAISALAASLYLLLASLGQESESSSGSGSSEGGHDVVVTRESDSNLEEHGLLAVALLALPVVIASIPWFTRFDEYRRPIIWSIAAFMVVASILTSLSYGGYYFPSAVLMLFAAAFDRPQRDD